MGLDSISAIALGLSLRLVIQASSPHPRVAGTLVGLWEGAVLYHFLERLPAGSLDPYLGLLVRVFVDFLITSSWLRQAIVLLWTAAGLVIADVTPMFWYDREMQRFVKRTERRLKEFRLEEFFGGAYERVKHFKWPTMALASWRVPNARRRARFFPIPPLPRIAAAQRAERAPSPPPPASPAPAATRTRIVAPGLSTPSVSTDSTATSGTATSTATSRTVTSSSRKSESVVSDQTVSVQTASASTSALPSAMRRTHSSSKSSSSGASASVTFSLPPEEPERRVQSVVRVPSSRDIPVMDDESEPPTPTLTHAPTAASSAVPPSLAASTHITPPSLASRFFSSTAALASSLPPISAISVPRALSAPEPALVVLSKPPPEPRPASLSLSRSMPAISLPAPSRPIPVVSGAMTPPPLRRHNPAAPDPPPPAQPPIRGPTSISMPVSRFAHQEPHIGTPGVTLNVDALPEIPPLITPALHTAGYRDSPPPPFSTLDPASSFVRSANEKQGYSGAAEPGASAPDLSAYAAHLRPPKPTASADANRDSLLSQHSIQSTSSLTGHSRLSVLSRADVLRQEALAEERAAERAGAERAAALRERRYGDAVRWKVDEGERAERARRLHERAAAAFLKAHNDLARPPAERGVPAAPDSANTSADSATSVVDVHRLRVREAVGAMERAIRDALLGGGERLRVVVGSGEARDPKLPVLKLALIRELEDHHLAASVDPDDPNVLVINLPVN